MLGGTTRPLPCITVYFVAAMECRCAICLPGHIDICSSMLSVSPALGCHCTASSHISRSGSVHPAIGPVTPVATVGNAQLVKPYSLFTLNLRRAAACRCLFFTRLFAHLCLPFFLYRGPREALLFNPSPPHMPRPSIRDYARPSKRFKSELGHGPKGKVYVSIAPIGRRDGRTRPGLSELLPQGRSRLLDQKGQMRLSAVLAERQKQAYESALATVQICAQMANFLRPLNRK
jgi:hypothetical protein